MAKRKAGIRMRSYGIYSHWDSRSKELVKNPEFTILIPTVIADPVVRVGVVAEGCADIPRRNVRRPATQHMSTAGCLTCRIAQHLPSFIEAVPSLAPLPYVAVHVVKASRVRKFLTNQMWCAFRVAPITVAFSKLCCIPWKL